MRIGLDIDNVITDFDKDLLKEVLIEDKNKRNSGIINMETSHIVGGMFDWSRDEIEDFFACNMERLAISLRPRRNCRKIIDKLLEDGHEIFLISHRNDHDYSDPFKVTTDWLYRHKIKYTKLILSDSPDKTRECREFNIDVMIDDRVSECEKMARNGINCLVMRTKSNLKDKHSLKVLTSWDNLYDEINKRQL